MFRLTYCVFALNIGTSQKSVVRGSTAREVHIKLRWASTGSDILEAHRLAADDSQSISACVEDCFVLTA